MKYETKMKNYEDELQNRLDTGFESAIKNLRNVQMSSLKFKTVLDAIKATRKEAAMYRNKIDYTQKEI